MKTSSTISVTYPHIYYLIKSHLLMEKETATHSSILAWKMPWTEEPGGLQRMGLQESSLATKPSLNVDVEY